MTVKNQIINAGKAFILICLFSWFTCKLFSQSGESTEPRTDFKHAINFCPGGVFLGIYATNYEFLFKDYHGLVVRFDYEDIPKSYTDANIESNGYSYMLSYRYHFRGEMKSEHLSAFARYKEYNGEGNLEGVSFDFSTPQTTFGLAGGKRWVWNSGINLNVMFGYGMASGERDITPISQAIEDRMDDFEDKYEFDGGFLGEVSLGYAF